MPKSRAKQFVLPFDKITIKDIPLVGGKGASLGEMYQRLTPRGVKVPPGFAVTAYAYRYLLKKAKLEKEIRKLLKGLNTEDLKDLAVRGQAVRQTILKAEFPPELKQAIVVEYRKLSKEFKTRAVDVAVRSSATAEDLPDASFAGQQESYLNIVGEKELLQACKECMASLFTDRAISYRVDKHFDHFKIGLSIAVQKMVRSDKACSGVMFTLDTESGFRDVVLINSSWGLGEYIVKGTVTPDEFLVFKPTVRAGFAAIINQQLGSKEKKLVYASRGVHPTKSLPVNERDQQRFSLKPKEVLQLARWGMEVEAHYKRPMDLEWAKDGRSGNLYIVQARPETVQTIKSKHTLEDYRLEKTSKVLVEGIAVGAKIGQGPVQLIKSVKEISKFKPGSVLVTEMTDPDWEPVMKQAAAIVTDSGGRTCHAAIVSRELGIPCIVGTAKGTRVLKTGRKVTVACSDGEVGKVYEGILPFVIDRTNLRELGRPKTKIMMNVGEPHQAFNFSLLPNDGVGLAREEFIINDSIKIHPLALLHFEKIKEPKVREKILQLTAGYSSKPRYFIDKLAQGVAMIAAGFYPKDAIVRLSDFKSNEYAGLIGGQQFEPHEDNPMIGWRGASRYYSPHYEAAFRLECKAFKKVREEYGLKNLKIMVPFCRTIEEGQKVLKIMASEGLKRGKDGLEIYMMCEIPANVILAKEFAQIFDGFSIGSNDLTQLTLGVDRDSALVAHVYDERNEAVKTLIRQVIKECKLAGRKIGICGQAPSDFPDFAEFLVREGIDSISLNPDSVLNTTLKILKLEKTLRRGGKSKRKVTKHRRK
ncbi:MAG TPA: phosphoenolpyruvate synthase [Candidatus Veblenbacteria bacterium]|uniref:Phosphoenolpyruvate synthase n=3 Tax=Candidatus Vebleniibacteriota TaxID=1817921 RepID=A0A1G2Q5K2_9BACT|nr:MAG: Phosphoenolpyruvate synthase [Parcubacteria group bacterium GW2011_GWF1_43_9]OHA55847.1 MAG: phosphoenolpyruvate synthase [Candidatus Veblenbacteria bacterium RIFOXYA2_FULL_43_9]HAO81214.1 phosphoenolpyruvate synthase [Candidatus Veblenbacteria bacterium]HBH16865.1 phosphoenolpyruvate synthase [Candidatus Veblenbacteria bacterium]